MFFAVGAIIKGRRADYIIEERSLQPPDSYTAIRNLKHTFIDSPNSDVSANENVPPPEDEGLGVSSDEEETDSDEEHDRLVDASLDNEELDSEERYAIIKTNTNRQFQLERLIYDKNSGPNNKAESIGKCPDVLKCFETINRAEWRICPVDCMAFERMDTILSDVPSKDHRSGSDLPRLIARSILQALVVLDQQGVVHNAVVTKNIFLSRVDTAEPEVKLGNFGCWKPTGQFNRWSGPQYLVYRAPEIWKGYPGTTKADVWSFGVCLVQWFVGGAGLFGVNDKTPRDHTNEWLIAKIKRLVGPIGSPRPDTGPKLVEEFKTASKYEEMSYEDPTTKHKEHVLLRMGSLREELAKRGVEAGAIDFIEHLLVIDVTRRPTAEIALCHSWLRIPVSPTTVAGLVHQAPIIPVPTRPGPANRWNRAGGSHVNAFPEHTPPGPVNQDVETEDAVREGTEVLDFNNVTVTRKRAAGTSPTESNTPAKPPKFGPNGTISSDE